MLRSFRKLILPLIFSVRARVRACVQCVRVSICTHVWLGVPTRVLVLVCMCTRRCVFVCVCAFSYIRLHVLSTFICNVQAVAQIATTTNLRFQYRNCARIGRMRLPNICPMVTWETSALKAASVTCEHTAFAWDKHTTIWAYSVCVGWEWRRQGASNMSVLQLHYHHSRSDTIIIVEVAETSSKQQTGRQYCHKPSEISPESTSWSDPNPSKINIEDSWYMHQLRSIMVHVVLW